MKKILSLFLCIFILFTTTLSVNADDMWYIYDMRCEDCGTFYSLLTVSIIDGGKICTQEDDGTYFCWICKEYKFLTVPATPCTFIMLDYNPPTYSEEGFAVYECIVCGVYYFEEFSAENSNEENEVQMIPLHGYAGSEGETYAKKYGLEFIVFDKGDADENTKVNIIDVTCMQKIIAKITSTNDFKTANCDLNGDGKLNIRDATLLQLYLANKIDKFPVQE